MKLSTVRIQQALDHLKPRAAVVPDNHPKVAELNEVFGEHTFFLDDDGLEIIEPAVLESEDGVEEEAGQVIRLAIWNDAARTILSPYPAETTGKVILFESVEKDPVDRAGEDSFPASDATFHDGGTDEDDV